MKILKSLSLVLVLTVVFSSFAISSFSAEAEDKVIISSIDDLPKLTNFKTGVTQIDAQQTGNVLSLSSDTLRQILYQVSVILPQVRRQDTVLYRVRKSSAMLNGKIIKI